MMKIGIGSKNPVKINAVKEAFHSINTSYLFQAFAAPSLVSEMPFSDDETIQGASNRAAFCLEDDQCDIGVGLEGGVTETSYGLCVCNWGVLIPRGKQPIIAGGGRFFLPKEISARLRDGEELGPVMDDYAQKLHVRTKEGAIGIFTNGRITRKAMFLHIMQSLIGQYEYWYK